MSDEQKSGFQIKKQADYVLVELPRFLVAEEAKAFSDQLPAVMENGHYDIVVLCEHVRELNPNWKRALMSAAKMLKANGKQIRLVALHESIQSVLKQEGIDQSLKSSPNIKAALVDLGLMKEKSLDVNFVNPFLMATVKVLATQSQTEAKAGQVYKKAARDKFHGDISGVIGLVSEAFTGSVVISFPSATFLGLMSRMLGEECKEISKEIEDGAGELTNIIFGQAKIVLNDLGYGIKTALPSVVTGEHHTILQMSNGPRVVIPFQTDLGPFFVEICVSA